MVPFHLYWSRSDILNTTSYVDHKLGSVHSVYSITLSWSILYEVLWWIMVFVLTICICFDPVLPVPIWIIATKCELGRVRLALVTSYTLLRKGSLRKYHDVFVWEHPISIVAPPVIEDAILDLIFVGPVWLFCGGWAFWMNFSVEHM